MTPDEVRAWEYLLTPIGFVMLGWLISMLVRLLPVIDRIVDRLQERWPFLFKSILD